MENLQLQYQYKYDHYEDTLLKSNDGHRWFCLLNKNDGQPIYNQYEKHLLQRERKMYQEAQERWTEDYIKMMDDPDYWDNYFHHYEEDLTEEQKEKVAEMAEIKKTKKKSNVIDFKERKAEKVDNDLKYKYFDSRGKFQHVHMAKDLHSKNPTYYDGQLLYTYNNGVYEKGTVNQLTNKIFNVLDDLYMKRHATNVIETFEAMNYITPSEFNKDDGFINTKNGLLNWKTGELLDHTPDRISTIQLAVKYNPKANDPNVLKFIKSVVPEDCINTLFEMVGYFLIPKTDKEKSFMLVGEGSNGKSVFIDMLDALIGESNISKLSLEDITNSNMKFRVAELEGKLINTFADISHKQVEDSAAFKILTSGESLTVEHKFKQPKKFKPFARLLFSANNIPSSADVSDGYFRRWEIIPFPNKFSSANGNKRKKEELIAELTSEEAKSTLLNYALEGLRRLYKNDGFTQAETLKKQKEDFMKKSDNILSFIEECCEFNSSAKASTKELFDTYKAYCKDNDFKPYAMNKFIQSLQDKYSLSKKKLTIGSGRKMGFEGIELNPTYSSYKTV